MKIDKDWKWFAVVICGGLVLDFFLHASWKNAAILGYLLTGFAVVALWDAFPPVGRGFWKALIPVALLHFVIVGGFVWVDFSLPDVNRLPRMLYGFAFIALVIECRIALWISDACARNEAKS